MELQYYFSQANFIQNQTEPKLFLISFRDLQRRPSITSNRSNQSATHAARLRVLNLFMLILRMTFKAKLRGSAMHVYQHDRFRMWTSLCEIIVHVLLGVDETKRSMSEWLRWSNHQTLHLIHCWPIKRNERRYEVPCSNNPIIIPMNYKSLCKLLANREAKRGWKSGEKHEIKSKPEFVKSPLMWSHLRSE